MGKRKTKTIQAVLGIIEHIPIYLGIFRNIGHNQAYSGIIQAYSKPCVTLAYPELWYIKNHGIFRTGDITSLNIFDGALWETANGYNYSCKLQLLSQYLLFMSFSSWNKYDFLMQAYFSLQKSLFNSKKVSGQGWGAIDGELWCTSWKFYSDITYCF